MEFNPILIALLNMILYNLSNETEVVKIKTKQYCTKTTIFMLVSNFVCWIMVTYLPLLTSAAIYLPLMGAAAGLLSAFIIVIICIVVPLTFFKKIHPAAGIYLFLSFSLCLFFSYGVLCIFSNISSV